MVTKCSPLLTLIVAGEIDVIVPALAPIAHTRRTDTKSVLFTRPSERAESSRSLDRELRKRHSRGRAEGRCDADHDFEAELQIVTSGGCQPALTSPSVSRARAVPPRW